MLFKNVKIILGLSAIFKRNKNRPLSSSSCFSNFIKKDFVQVQILSTLVWRGLIVLHFYKFPGELHFEKQSSTAVVLNHVQNTVPLKINEIWTLSKYTCSEILYALHLLSFSPEFHPKILVTFKNSYKHIQFHCAAQYCIFKQIFQLFIIIIMISDLWLLLQKDWTH